ncbi:helix-turn-helix domain-containing protein [Glutamicibacter sp.]|uniref:helix-turn-helix domain-containing protein n=1 Tax=Glutamicibacter sp. TaxID=1931995 RepID=UPI003D6A14E4
MESAPDPRGVLYPARLPAIERFSPGAGLQDLVSWFWLVDWNIAPGRTSRQELLPFPQMNLVIEPEGITLSGPASGASHRDLSGSSWAVSALLRPAAAQALKVAPVELLDQEMQFSAPGLLAAIAKIKAQPEQADAGPACAERFGSWLTAHLPAATSSGLQANELLDTVAAERGIVRVSQLAQRLSLSTRSLQRISERYLGLVPLAVIRRYRLQEAAHRLREDPAVSIAGIAAELGYADQAHLAADFRKVLGYSPGTYRKAETSLPALPPRH